MCINRVMIKGKKSTARGIVYDAFDHDRAAYDERPPLDVFDQALRNATPWSRSSLVVWVARPIRFRSRWRRIAALRWRFVG